MAPPIVDRRPSGTARNHRAALNLDPILEWSKPAVASEFAVGRKEARQEKVQVSLSSPAVAFVENTTLTRKRKIALDYVADLNGPGSSMIQVRAWLGHVSLNSLACQPSPSPTNKLHQSSLIAIEPVRPPNSAGRTNGATARGCSEDVIHF